MGAEDDIFCANTKNTRYRQHWNKYLPSQRSLILQHLQNQGCGNSMVSTLIKTPDYLSTSYVGEFFPAIAPNSDGDVQECSWVNAAPVYAIKTLSIKIGSQLMFSVNGHMMLVLMDLYGQTEDCAEMIGYFKTKAQLIANSKRDRHYTVPMVGMPFQGREDLAFATGAVAFHQISCELQSRPISELIVNYGSFNTKRGLLSLPKEVKTGTPISSTSVQFVLATNCVWVGKEEKSTLVHG
jgi:hypothetical protein